MSLVALIDDRSARIAARKRLRELSAARPGAQPEHATVAPSAAPAAAKERPDPISARMVFAPSTNKDKTFDTLIIGKSNNLAIAAAKEASQSWRGSHAVFNPLFIYGQPGVGKSHVLQATAWAAAESCRKVIYLTAENFMWSLMGRRAEMSHVAYNEMLLHTDIMLIDDVQHLAGGTVLAEFLRIVSMMTDDERQVVLAADRPPLELENINERVRSRLAGGLVVEMGSLGEELLLDILNARVTAARTHHPNFDVPAPVLAHIAKSVTHNGRDLEGAVNRLLALSKLSGQPITLELAEREIRDLVRPQEPRKVKIEEIQRIVARRYNVSRGDLLSSRRTANVVRPRQIAMYLAKTLTLRSLPEIGRCFGGRDHTTVLHAVRKIEGLVGNDGALAEEIEAIKKELEA